MKNIKKLLISIIVVLAVVLLAYRGYKVIAKSTNEMISSGDGLPKEFPYVRYKDLINEKDTLCCGRGIHLPRDKETIVKTGKKSQEEPYLTIKDIGKKIFKGEKIILQQGGTVYLKFLQEIKTDLTNGWIYYQQ